MVYLQLMTGDIENHGRGINRRVDVNSGIDRRVDGDRGGDRIES